MLLQAWKGCDVIVQRRYLERHRAWIIRVEHGEIAHRRKQGPDQVARAIGDLAIHQGQEDIEVLVAGFVVGKLARKAHRVDGALGASAHFEKPPAGGTVHVFLREACKARKLLQRQFGGADNAIVILNLLA